jgi:Rap1a immunity proteins
VELRFRAEMENRMKKIFLTSVAALFLATGTTPASAFSTKDLARMCIDMRPKDREVDVTCSAYIRGVVDTFDAWSIIHEKHGLKKLFCLPEEITNRIVVEIVIQRLRTHPEDYEYVPVVAITRALNGAFPCEKQP